MPAPICALRPSAVSWSELSHFGARSAIHCSARFSMEAVSAWLIRRAGRKVTSIFVVADATFIFDSFQRLRSVVTSTDLFAQSLTSGAQGEFQRFARNALHKRSNCPAEAVGNGSGQRDRLDLHVQSRIAFFVAPVGIQAPQE